MDKYGLVDWAQKQDSYNSESNPNLNSNARGLAYLWEDKSWTEPDVVDSRAGGAGGGASGDSIKTSAALAEGFGAKSTDLGRSTIGEGSVAEVVKKLMSTRGGSGGGAPYASEK